jgi:hypothetical protein
MKTFPAEHASIFPEPIIPKFQSGLRSQSYFGGVGYSSMPIEANLN